MNSTPSNDLGAICNLPEYVDESHLYRPVKDVGVLEVTQLPDDYDYEPSPIILKFPMKEVKGEVDYELDSRRPSDKKCDELCEEAKRAGDELDLITNALLKQLDRREERERNREIRARRKARQEEPELFTCYTGNPEELHPLNRSLEKEMADRYMDEARCIELEPGHFVTDPKSIKFLDECRARITKDKLESCNVDDICEMAEFMKVLEAETEKMRRETKYLWEILVPTEWHTADEKGVVDWDSELKPVRLRHHRIWDEKVVEVTGGLTIVGKVGGKWISKEGRKYEEGMIACRIMCTADQIREIATFSLKHYRQKAIMYYKLSSESYIVEEEDGLDTTQAGS